MTLTRDIGSLMTPADREHHPLYIFLRDVEINQPWTLVIPQSGKLNRAHLPIYGYAREKVSIICMVLLGMSL